MLHGKPDRRVALRGWSLSCRILNRGIHLKSRRLVGLLSCLGIVVGTAAFAPVGASAAPMVIGGSSGSPVAGAAVAIDIGGDYNCTGSLWRPRILITAAHCLQKEDGGLYAPGDVRVWLPGANTAGPASDVKVTEVIADPYWSSAASSYDEEVGRDIAALILDQPLGQPVWSRMATPAEVAALSWTYAKAEFVGYGTTTPRVDPNAVLAPTPSAVKSRLRYFYEFGLGAYQVMGNEESGTCGGDSGGPWMSRIAGELVLIGPLSGGQGLPCDKPELPDETYDDGAVASANTDVLNVALAAVGEAKDVTPTTCIKGRDIDRTCWDGRAWEYSYCWSAKKADLWRYDGRDWRRVEKIFGWKDKSCGKKYPYRIEFRGIPTKKSEWYEVVIPRQAGLDQEAFDPFKVSVS